MNGSKGTSVQWVALATEAALLKWENIQIEASQISNKIKQQLLA